MTWPGNYYGLLLQTNYDQTTATINPKINTSQSEKIPIGGPRICYSQLDLDLDNNYPRQCPITQIIPITQEYQFIHEYPFTQEYQFIHQYPITHE